MEAKKAIDDMFGAGYAEAHPSGAKVFFVGYLNHGNIITLKRAGGVSERGRELWSLSLGRRKPRDQEVG